MTAPYAHEQISPTAKLLACLRAQSDIPYARAIAEDCQACQVASQLFPELSAGPAGRYFAYYAELRFKSLTAAVRRFGADTILEIASGMSPRGLIMTTDPQTLYLETDLPQLLAEKRRVCEMLEPDRPNLQFAPLNALDPAEFSTLGEALPPRQSTAVIHEGLLLYLTRAEQSTLAHNIRSILQVRPRSAWITTDLFLKDRYPEAVRNRPQAQSIHKTIVHSTGRDTAANYFDNAQHALEFFGGHGFAVQRWRQSDLVETLSISAPPGVYASAIAAEEVWMMIASKTSA